MKGMIFTFLWLLAAVLLIVSSGSAQFNPNPTLLIGNSAPVLKVQTFVKGKTVTEFKKGQVYVLDFWATWCGGCIASFPHISKVAEKYKNKVHFISVDSYEDVVEENKGKDPVQLVTEFLKTPKGQKLKLDVAVDGQTNQMFATWIKTLRRGGFPTTFVIDQEGKIAWVDVNLDHLDWVLKQVLAKKWDRQKAAEIMKQKDAAEDLMFAVFRSKETDKTKEYLDLLNAAETFEKRFPDRKDAVAFYKFMALLELDISRVPALLEQMAKDPLSRYINLSDASGLTLRKPNLSREMFAALVKVQERLLSNEYPEKGYGGKTVAAYKTLAETYQNVGDSKKAVSALEKAITLANQQNLPADHIKKLNETLEKYKQTVGVVK